jgi:hypothetical protein
MEIWKDIIGYEGLYQVSNLGRIKSFHNGEKILKCKTDKDGYLEVTLCANGNHKYMRVHRVVLNAFNPLTNENEFQVNHKNGVKNDNRIENLEWVTYSENVLHSLYELGNIKYQDRSGLNKPFKVYKKDINGLVIQEYKSMREVEQLERIDKRKLKKHALLNKPINGFYWEVII